jgi:hypothetical protein
VLDACPHRGFRVFAHAGPCGGRRLVGSDQAFGVFAVADAVIEKVPVECVGAGESGFELRFSEL